MVLFPHCKINLGLRVLRKREDGYHDLETVFYPLPVHDMLEFLPSRGTSVSCTLSGLPIQGKPEDNLCVKGWQLLKNDFPQLPPVDIWLHKKIPMGAGLGGGSSDCAFFLKGLNDHFKLGITLRALISYAIKLGSDCPFFLQEGPCLGTGRGDVLQPIDLKLNGYYWTLIYPGISISTAWAYGQIQPNEQHKDTLAGLIKEGPLAWKQRLHNDFEPVAFASHPELKSVIDLLYQKGAVYAAMSGSGSSLFGLFTQPVSIRHELPSGYWVQENIPSSVAKTR
ncbi:MAG: 4-(cytidine 5'-diphospho)-2-C-methyl-D-erythritol kinase, partial [Chitinophagaceae bacterium]